jgi:hypothetical protein
MVKVFRVFISETQGFHHDIEAESAYAAKQKVRASFKGNDGSEDIQPVEDSSSCTGYQVDDAIEIPREDSDLA